MDDQKDDFRVQTPRRVEIFNGRGHRQRWSEAMKATIVVESLKPGIVITELARRYGACTSQVHGWRKDAREGRLVLPAAPAFAEVVVAPHQVSTPGAKSRAYKPRLPETGAAIEISARGVQVRVGVGADPTVVSAIVHALKDAS